MVDDLVRYSLTTFFDHSGNVYTGKKGSRLSRSRRRVDAWRDEFAGGMRLRVSDITMRMSNCVPFNSVALRKYETRLAQYNSALPVLRPADAEIAGALASHGIASRRIHLGADAGAAAERAVDWLRHHSPVDTVGYLPHSVLAGDPALFLWGLAETNLDIAERHIGLPVRYHGLEVRAERTTPAVSRHLVRDWHFDVEDRRMLKIVVYLSDVDESTGPFEFLPSAASDLARATLRVRPGLTFLPDADVSAAVPSSAWEPITGPAGTAVYADTARLLHRVKAPTGGDRYSATFVYTSDRPRHTLSRFMPPRHIVQSLLGDLTPRQRRALAAEPERAGLRASAKIAG